MTAYEVAMGTGQKSEKRLVAMMVVKRIVCAVGGVVVGVVVETVANVVTSSIP